MTTTKPSFPQPKRGGGADPWDWAAVSLVFALFLVLAAPPVASIPFHVPRNDNEGWNAYLALAAMNGGALYPPADSFIVDNYPPLSFYIVGAFGRLIGDQVVAGRIIALLSLLLVAGAVYRLCRWTGATRSLATLGSGLFLVAISSLAYDYVALDDPQILGHALITWGAVVFLGDRTAPAGRWRIVVSALLILAGGLIKHNLVALPLALATYAAIHERRRLIEFVIVSAALGAAALSLLYVIWGPAIFEDVLAHARGLSLARMARFSERASVTVLPYVGLTAVACAIFRRRPAFHFVFAYAIWSALAGFPALAGAGTNLNLLFDFMIAVVVGSVGVVTALSPDAATATAGRPWRRRAALVALALPLTIRGAVAADLHVGQYVDLLRREADWTGLERQLSDADGPVACQMLSLCYWAGKPEEIDFFNYGQKLSAGAVSDRRFRDRINAHFYRYIVLDREDSAEGWRFAASLLRTGPAAGADASGGEPFVPQKSLPSEAMALLLAQYEPVRLVGDRSMLFAPKDARQGNVSP